MKEPPKYPQCIVKLNAKEDSLTLLASVQREMNRHRVPAEDIGKFFTEAVTGDYNHLLETIQKWVNVRK
jgi:hypothetical protein